MQDDVLTTLAWNLFWVSFMAVGGTNVVVPELFRIAVESQHWMSAKEFPQLFALAQAAPGPNVLFVSIIGWKAAGITGAFTAMLAVCLPSTTITLIVAHYLERFRAAPWRITLQLAVAPVAAGLLLSAGVVLMRAAAQSAVPLAITTGVVVLSFRYNPNPLWFIVGGAVLGILFI